MNDKKLLSGLKNKKRRTGLSLEEQQALHRQYEKGSSVRDLAELTGHSYGWVHRNLKSTGVEFRSWGGSRTKKKKTK